MKKLALLMLMLVLALGMLVACDGEGDDVTTPDPSVTTTTVGGATTTTAPVTTKGPLETFFDSFSEKGTMTVTVDLTDLGYFGEEGDTAKVVLSLGADVEEGLGLATFNLIMGELETGDVLVYIKNDEIYFDLTALEGGLYKFDCGITEEELLETPFYQMLDAYTDGQLTSVLEAASLFTEEDMTTALAFVEEYVLLFVDSLNIPEAPETVPGTITIAGTEIDANKASFKLTAATLASALKTTLTAVKADEELGAFVAATYDKVMLIMQNMMPAPADAAADEPTAGEAFWNEVVLSWIEGMIAENGMLDSMGLAFPADKYYIEITEWSLAGVSLATTITAHVDHNAEELVYLPWIAEEYLSTAFEVAGTHYYAVLNGDYWFIREKTEDSDADAEWYKIAVTEVNADETKLQDPTAWSEPESQPEGLFDTTVVNHLVDVEITLHTTGMSLAVDYVASCTEYAESSRYNYGTSFTQETLIAVTENGATLTIETVVDDETQTIELEFVHKENGATLTLNVTMDTNDGEEILTYVLDFTATETDATTTYLFTIDATSNDPEVEDVSMSLEAVYTKATGEFVITGTYDAMGTFEIYGEQKLTETKLTLAVNKFVLTGPAVEGEEAPEPIVYEFDVSVVLENTLGTIPEGTGAVDVLQMNEEALADFMEEIMGIVSQFMPEPRPELTPGA